MTTLYKTLTYLRDLPMLAIYMLLIACVHAGWVLLPLAFGLWLGWPGAVGGFLVWWTIVSAAHSVGWFTVGGSDEQ